MFVNQYASRCPVVVCLYIHIHTLNILNDMNEQRIGCNGLYLQKYASCRQYYIFFPFIFLKNTYQHTQTNINASFNVVGRMPKILRDVRLSILNIQTFRTSVVSLLNNKNQYFWATALWFVVLLSSSFLVVYQPPNTWWGITFKKERFPLKK